MSKKIILSLTLLAFTTHQLDAYPRNYPSSLENSNYDWSPTKKYIAIVHDDAPRDTFSADDRLLNIDSIEPFSGKTFRTLYEDYRANYDQKSKYAKLSRTTAECRESLPGGIYGGIVVARVCVSDSAGRTTHLYCDALELTKACGFADPVNTEPTLRNLQAIYFGHRSDPRRLLFSGKTLHIGNYSECIQSVEFYLITTIEAETIVPTIGHDDIHAGQTPLCTQLAYIATGTTLFFLIIKAAVWCAERGITF